MKTSLNEDKQSREVIHQRAFRIKRYFVCGAVSWVVLISFFLYWDIKRERDKQFQFALQEARTHLLEDHALQMWITTHSKQEKSGDRHAGADSVSLGTVHPGDVTQLNDKILYKHTVQGSSDQGYNLFHARHAIFHGNIR